MNINDAISNAINSARSQAVTVWMRNSKLTHTSAGCDYPHALELCTLRHGQPELECYRQIIAALARHGVNL